MKTIKLNNLFEAARRETAPAVDVADTVLTMLAIGRQTPSASLNRSLMWISMASSAVAAGIVLAAFLTWQNNTDSVNEIISVVAWVTQ